MEFNPFDKQQEVLQDPARFKALLASKRSGKSEVCYAETIKKGNQQPNYNEDEESDPFEMAIIGPSWEMLETLVWPKFRRWAKPFERKFNAKHQIFYWNHNNTIIYSASGEKITRIEGKKLRHIHITEAFQVGRHVWKEALARVSDSEGTITLDGSFTAEMRNPQAHWIYTEFVKKKFPESKTWIWHTKDNPYFPKQELELQKEGLDLRSYKLMYEMDFSVKTDSAVYEDFGEENQRELIPYNDIKDMEISISIDWGFSSEMACLFFAYDKPNDTVYLFDEIVGSRIKLPKLYDRIRAKRYKIDTWYCDIAGKKESELALSNVEWFRKPPRNIHFKHRASMIAPGLNLVRSYIKNALGQRKLIMCKTKCAKTIDDTLNYYYPQTKEGVILNENPLKDGIHDHTQDAKRYYFWNRHDRPDGYSEFKSMRRF